MSDETIQTIKHRIDKMGDAAGVLFTIDGKYVGLGDLIEQLVRAVIAEQKSSTPVFDSVIVREGDPDAGPNLDGLFSSAGATHET